MPGAGAAAGVTMISDGQTSLCLDSNSSSPSYPANGEVYTEHWTGGNAQEWAVRMAPHADAGLCNVYTAWCLDSNCPAASNPTPPGTGTVYTDQRNGDNHQSWQASIPLLQGTELFLLSAPSACHPAAPSSMSERSRSQGHVVPGIGTVSTAQPSSRRYTRLLRPRRRPFVKTRCISLFSVSAR